MSCQDFLYELQLHSAAAYFDLGSKAERRASVRAVEDFFFHLSKAFSPELLIEAGAKDGRVSRRARRYLPQARIVAFEANPYNFAEYAPRIDKDDRVEFLNLALDQSSGSAELQLQVSDGVSAVDSRNGCHSLLKRADSVSTYESISVPAVSLDDFFANEILPCALWIDVEGATGRVLSGAKSVLAAASYLITEVEDRPIWSDQWLRQEVMAFLMEAGFMPIVRDFQSRYQYNIVFVRTALLDTAYFRHALAIYFSTIGSRRRSTD